MSFLDMFRVSKIKAELEQTRADRDTLKATLSDTEHLEYYELRKRIDELAAQKVELESVIAGLDATFAKRHQEGNRELADLERQMKEKRGDLA